MGTSMKGQHLLDLIIVLHVIKQSYAQIILQPPMRGHAPDYTNPNLIQDRNGLVQYPYYSVPRPRYPTQIQQLQPRIPAGAIPYGQRNSPIVYGNKMDSYLLQPTWVIPPPEVYVQPNMPPECFYTPQQLSQYYMMPPLFPSTSKSAVHAPRSKGKKTKHKKASISKVHISKFNNRSVEIKSDKSLPTLIDNRIDTNDYIDLSSQKLSQTQPSDQVSANDLNLDSKQDEFTNDYYEENEKGDPEEDDTDKLKNEIEQSLYISREKITTQTMLKKKSIKEATKRSEKRTHRNSDDNKNNNRKIVKHLWMPIDDSYDSNNL